MAKTINTRIRLKYDNFTNWTTNNPVLLAGEIAVVVVPAEQDDNLQTTKPAVLFKVGDGSSQFNALPWASALAADVYGWAKAATKPSYTYSEVGAAAATHNHVAADITDFDEKVKALISGNIKDTNTTYQIVANGDNSFKLQSKELDDEDWTDAYTFTVDFSTVNTAIAAKYTKPEDGIPLSDLDASVQGSIGQAHTHTNKEELDKITSGKVAAWDGAVSAVANKVEKVVGVVDNFVAFDAEGAIKDSGKKASDFEVAGTADSKIQAHNIAGNAHSDIRALITALQETVGGLGNALHFVGAGADASKPAEGKNGDVYIATDTNKEYVWSGEGWEEFGSPEHLTKVQADGYYDAKGTAQELVDAAKSELNSAIEAVDGKADANTAEVTKIKDGSTVVPKATSATNVTTNINGKAIADIFESDGLKVKKATLADTATEATHAASATNADEATHAASADSATEATHATNADNATNATHATSADTADSANSATNATQLGGKAADTYLNTADEIIFDCGNSVIA